MKNIPRSLSRMMLLAAVALLAVLAPRTAHAQANITCDGAFELFDNVPFPGQSTRLVPLGDISGATCVSESGTAVWFKYTATANGSVRVATTGSSYNTVLQVHTGDCLSLVPVVCDHVTCNLRSVAVFEGTAGVTYLIRAAGYIPPPPDSTGKLWKQPWRFADRLVAGCWPDSTQRPVCGRFAADARRDLVSNQRKSNDDQRSRP
jgi:hypothetical protein